MRLDPLGRRIAEKLLPVVPGPDPGRTFVRKADKPHRRVRAQDVDIDFSVTGDPQLCYHADRATGLWGTLDTFFVRLPAFT
jgi:hypothetical protein